MQIISVKLLTYVIIHDILILHQVLMIQMYLFQEENVYKFIQNNRENELEIDKELTPMDWLIDCVERLKNR